MKNFLSMDIETWAYGDTPELRALTSAERKALDAGYVLDSTRRVLALLREAGVKITLFVIGEQLEWYPELGEEILADGHELGLHAFRHYRIDDLETLRADLDQAAPQVRRFGIRGYRAPLIHLPEGGLEVLAEHGFTFDSSVYGPFSLAGTYAGIREVPISSLMLYGGEARMALPRHLSFGNILRTGEFPFGASYFVGLLGGAVRPLIRQMNRRGRPAVVFLHNWQVVPRPAGAFPPPGYVWRHPLYWPLARNIAGAFRRLLAEFEFDKMSAAVAAGGDAW
ncbi:MAG: polysaccharide deacetylase family protein [Verrucomicrobiota bacterium]|jgi:peptidoglycan/xylan/chitin deacetylase (PgdA/CDA1 family)|nr:polysaccharide deacetylase family protein [Verrucomicrobiota bacterium]